MQLAVATQKLGKRSSECNDYFFFQTFEKYSDGHTPVILIKAPVASRPQNSPPAPAPPQPGPLTLSNSFPPHEAAAASGTSIQRL